MKEHVWGRVGDRWEGPVLAPGGWDVSPGWQLLGAMRCHLWQRPGQGCDWHTRAASSGQGLAGGPGGPCLEGRAGPSLLEWDIVAPVATGETASVISDEKTFMSLYPYR